MVTRRAMVATPGSVITTALSLPLSPLVPHVLFHYIHHCFLRRMHMRTLLLLCLTLAIPRCSDDPTPLGVPESCEGCTGCCDLVLGCLAGDTGDNCGTAGEACFTCNSEQSCTLGKCEDTPCSNGCLVPDTTACRVPGTDSDACGPLGGHCDNCSAKDQLCDAEQRSCVDRPDECDPEQLNSCKGQSHYCDETRQCRKCLDDTYNCNTENVDQCEADKPCGEPTYECINEIETWPVTYVTAGVAGTLTQGELRLSDKIPYVLLRVEDFHKGGTYPKNVTFSAATKMKNPGCDVCVLVAEGCTGYQGSAENYYNCTGKLFFVQEGTGTVTQADATGTPGAFSATFTGLKLLEWDEENDKPVTDGACWKVDSVTLDASW